MSGQVLPRGPMVRNWHFHCQGLDSILPGEWRPWKPQSMAQKIKIQVAILWGKRNHLYQYFCFLYINNHLVTPSRGNETFWAEQVTTEGKLFCSWDNKVSLAHYIAGGTLIQLFVTKTISQDSNCPVEVAAPSGPEGGQALTSSPSQGFTAHWLVGSHSHQSGRRLRFSCGARMPTSGQNPCSYEAHQLQIQISTISYS